MLRKLKIIIPAVLLALIVVVLGVVEKPKVAEARTCVGVGLRAGTTLTVPDTQPCPSPLVDSSRVTTDEGGNPVLNPAKTEEQKSVVYADNKNPPKIGDTAQITCKTLDSCIILLVYYVGPGIAGWVASIGAYFFSMVVQLSLNSTAYALDFLSTGWTTVRDIANMAFIFILIYIALTVMLAAETSGTIKTLAVVVVIALLVNFSFFFTRLVIDAGNIVAVQFYNAIPYHGDISGTKTKDLSLSIMNAVKPQELLNSAMLKNAQLAAGSNWGAVAVYLVLFLSVAAMLWMLFFAFLQVGIKFMMRIVGLWFVLIASPLAFVARTMPKTKHFFDQWVDYLIKFSFYPAVFLFMFWILTKFTTSILSTGSGGTGNGSLMNALFQNPATGATSDLGTMTAVATVGIRMGFVIAVLYVGLKVSDWIVKEGSATASKITGWSTGKAFGTMGFLGRASVGSIGGALATNQRLASSKNVFAQGLWRAGRYASRSSFDARGLPGARTALGVLGGDVIKGSRVDVGTPGGEGGVEEMKKKVDERRKKDKSERAAIVRDASNQETIKRIADDLKNGRGHSQDDVDRVKNFTKREMAAFKTADVEKIAHIINENQLKGEVDSENRTDAEKESIRRIADPIIKSQKIVADELRKASSALRMSAVTTVQANTTKGSRIDSAAITAMHLDVDSQKAIHRAYILAHPAENHGERSSDLTQLQNMTTSLNALSKHVAKIQSVGTRAAQTHYVD